MSAETILLTLYDKLLSDCLPALEQGTKYCAFAARKGHQWPGDVMFCGRALNGWLDPFELEDLGTELARLRVAEAIIASSTRSICEGDDKMLEDPACVGLDDPMHWVNHTRNISNRGYRKGSVATSSAYWRLIGKLLPELRQSNQMCDGLGCWATSVAWSNLYKLAPWAGGNPFGRLATAQFASCFEILVQELIALRPRCVVFLTEVNKTQEGWFGPFERRFVQDERCTWQSGASTLQFVCALGSLAIEGIRINVVIAEHPQGRNEAEFAKSLLSALNSLA
jgi:hypothetical protein